MKTNFSWKEVSIIYRSWSDFRGCSGLKNLPTFPQTSSLCPTKKAPNCHLASISLKIRSSKLNTVCNNNSWCVILSSIKSTEPHVKPRDKRLTPRYFGAKCCCCRLTAVQMPSLSLSKLANRKAKMLNWSAGDDFLWNEGFDSVSCKDPVSIFDKFSWIH